MALFRQRLRLLAIAWLLFQAASVSALVPLSCCATPAPVAAASDRALESCHQKETAPVPEPVCVMRGVCAGPEAALATLLGSVGIVASDVRTSFQLHVSASVPSFVEVGLNRLLPPDAPPPRL